MNSTIIIILAIFARSISSSRIYPTKNVEQISADNPIPYDTWDEAAELLEELEDTVSRAQQVAFEQSRKISNEFGLLTNMTRYQGSTLVRVGVIKIERQLENLLVLAEALGTGRCLEARDEELRVVSEKVNQVITECIDEVEAEVKDIINRILFNVNEAQTIVAGYRSTLEEECSRETWNEECILPLIGNLRYAKASFPTMILDETLRLTELYETYRQPLADCTDFRVGLIYTEGNKIVLEVESCIVDTDFE